MSTNRFTYRKRLFLGAVTNSDTSYVFAEIESSQGGCYKLGRYVLRIADSYSRVEFEFFLSTAGARRRSMARIDCLIRELSRFRESLARESKLIATWPRREVTGKATIN